MSIGTTRSELTLVRIRVNESCRNRSSLTTAMRTESIGPNVVAGARASYGCADTKSSNKFIKTTCDPDRRAREIATHGRAELTSLSSARIRHPSTKTCGRISEMSERHRSTDNLPHQTGISSCDADELPTGTTAWRRCPT